MSGGQRSATTHVCLLTAEGRSAVAVVGVSGPAAVAAVDQHFAAANERPLSQQHLLRILYGHWAQEDLVVCRTGNEEVEVHCHGGAQSSQRVVAALEATGCNRISPAEWNALHADSELEAEALWALSQAYTKRTASYLLSQAQGAMEREAEAIRSLLHQDQLPAAEMQIARLLERKDFGQHLASPWQVVIAGAPNVGKSSLINALVGYERAIVFDQPGTTRDVVSASTALEGWPVELSDTAGLHETRDTVEIQGIQRAREQLRQADLVLWVLEASRLPSSPQSFLLDIVQEEAMELEVSLDLSRTLVVVNKIDLAPEPLAANEDFYQVSATLGTGISELLTAAADKLVPQPPDTAEAIPLNLRQLGCLQQALLHCQARACSAALVEIERLLGNR